MITLPCLIIRLFWDQAGSGGSGFTRRGEMGFSRTVETDFAGSKLLPVDLASLAAENLDSL